MRIVKRLIVSLEIDAEEAGFFADVLAAGAEYVSSYPQEMREKAQRAADALQEAADYNV